MAYILVRTLDDADLARSDARTAGMGPSLGVDDEPLMRDAWL